MIRLFRLYSFLFRHNVPVFPRLLYFINRILFSVVLPPSAIIGRNVTFAYQGLATVIHARSCIGNNVFIGPNVIIGGRGGERDVPVIEDGVFLGAGSRIMGSIRIGKGATVAAAALVISDVPSGATVAGVPARVINSTRKESPTIK